ncbi:MAG: hypothetical protein N3C60_07035 [Calditerrivibrio sp.]|nr:hypothetical protein [Calditerrivibrio sp.]
MKRLMFLMFVVYSFWGCSVYMASTSEGLKPLELQKGLSRCSNRTCVLLMGPKVISSNKHADGTTVEEYRFNIDDGSVQRAVMHGLLDLVTLGIWEIAGTPIESSRKKSSYIFIRITYDKDENILRTDIR